MNKIKKLTNKLFKNPKGFTFDELSTLMNALDIKADNKGKTSGSRIRFKGKTRDLLTHKPHPGNELKLYQIRDVQKFLESEGIKHD